jgi:hypothetical protein
MPNDNFIESYLDFYAGTEPPTIYNRWCAISGIAALLGRQTWVQHGHSKIFPNQYIMLVGEAGCRKSTAIKTFLKPLITEAGFNKIAASKTSKEKFLMDLAEGMDQVNNPEGHLNVNEGAANWGKNKTMQELFGIVDASEPAECLIMADEFNVFMGHSNIEFIDMLTDLWDYNGIFAQRTKSGKSVLVPNPTINGLFGNTQIGISMSFPTEVIGQGFFSRLLLIYSDPSGRKITKPPVPNSNKRKELIEKLVRIKGKIRGELLIEDSAWDAFDEIYQNWKELEDVRFKSYSTRRLTHLLKLSLCCAAANERQTINTNTVEYANTILHYTEAGMPKALGEFGKARNSDVSAKILNLLDHAEKPLDILKEIWPQVHRDLESTRQLAEIMGAMKAAGKIQQVGSGFLPQHPVETFDFPYCKPSILREYLENRAKNGLPL